MQLDFAGYRLFSRSREPDLVPELGRWWRGTEIRAEKHQSTSYKTISYWKKSCINSKIPENFFQENFGVYELAWRTGLPGPLPVEALSGSKKEHAGEVSARLK